MFFLRFCLFWGVALGFLPLLQGLEPRLAALNAFAVQFAVGNLVLVLLLLAFRRRLRSWRWWAIAGLAASIWNTMIVWPEMTFHESQPPDATAPLKVVSFNLWYANDDLDATLAYLAHSGADVIGLVEATPRLRNALAPLKVLYPYSVDCIGRDPACEIMLISKLPLRNPYAGKIDGRYPFVDEGEIDWGGRPLTIAMTHLSWPFLLPDGPEFDATVQEPLPPELPDVPRLTQSLQAANLARHVNGLPNDLVLMGDFNSAAWSPMQRAFRAATGLDNRGHYLPSWPRWAGPVFRLPIDHVFVRGGWRVTGMRLGPSLGSDHLPVEAEIAIRP